MADSGVVIIIATGIIFSLISFIYNWWNKGAEKKRRWKVIIPIVNTILAVLSYRVIPSDGIITDGVILFIFLSQVAGYFACCCCSCKKHFRYEAVTTIIFIIILLVCMGIGNTSAEEHKYEYNIVEQMAEIEEKQVSFKNATGVEIIRDRDGNKTFIEVLKVCQAFNEEEYQENCKCTREKTCRFCELSMVGTKYIIHLPKG